MSSLSEILTPQVAPDEQLAPLPSMYECVCVNVTNAVKGIERSVDWKSAYKCTSVYLRNPMGSYLLAPL